MASSSELNFDSVITQVGMYLLAIIRDQPRDQTLGYSASRIHVCRTGLRTVETLDMWRHGSLKVPGWAGLLSNWTIHELGNAVVGSRVGQNIVLVGISTEATKLCQVWIKNDIRYLLCQAGLWPRSSICRMSKNFNSQEFIAAHRARWLKEAKRLTDHGQTQYSDVSQIQGRRP